MDLLEQLAGFVLLILVAWVGLGFLGTAVYWFRYQRPRRDDPSKDDRRGY